MKDIYRAALRSGGGWVYWNHYGQICTASGKRHSFKKETSHGFSLYYNIEQILRDIEASSMGRWTGLNDENGTKIFEGDIVRVHERGFPGYLGVCSFLCGAFGVEFSFAAGKMSFTPFEQFRDASFTPVGNIHDNPELLGGVLYETD